MSIVTSLATAPTTSIPGRAMPAQISWTLAIFFTTVHFQLWTFLLMFKLGHPSLVSRSLGLESATVLGTH